jgi:biopolymer transport protein TolR
MIVTPLIQKGVDAKLPNAQFTVPMPESPDVVLTVKKDSRDPKGYLLFVNQDKVTLETLQNALEEAFLTVSEKKLYLKADQEIEYGVFTEFLWDTIRAAGIESVGIITEKKTEKGD